jgi:hypothetical protein
MVLSILLCSTASAFGQVGVSLGVPGLSIGINLPVYPTMVVVPGYPVYYDPQVNLNYFFYDGMFWVYQQDNWYASPWYNGPWELVAPETVPLFILRVPVRYYRYPPAYFQGWSVDAAPRWDEHWGATWAERRRGWDNWNHASVPPAAPLPVYQRQYSGNRYPSVQQQQVLVSQNYRYQPQDAVAQQYYRAHVTQTASAASQAAPAPARGQPPQKGREVQRPAVAKAPAQEPMTQAQRNASVRPPAQAQEAETQRSTAAKQPTQEAKTQTQRAAVARAPAQAHEAEAQRNTAAKQPQEPKTQTQRAAVARPPAQAHEPETQRNTAAKQPQEPKTQTQRAAAPPTPERKIEPQSAAKPPSREAEARTEPRTVARAPTSEPKERPEEGNK